MEHTTDWKSEVLTRLTPAQRIELAMDLWDSVLIQENPVLVSEADRIELRLRADALTNGSMQSRPWHEVKQSLLKSPS